MSRANRSRFALLAIVWSIALQLDAVTGQQPNTPTASAIWNRENHVQGGTGPIPVTLTSTTITLDVSSGPNPNMPYAWVTSTPCPGSGIALPYGFFDLNPFTFSIIMDGIWFSTNTLWDFFAVTNLSGDSNWMFPICNPYMTMPRCHQFLVTDPTCCGGFKLSAATDLVLTCGLEVMVPPGDDVTFAITQGPWCPTTEFFGTVHNVINVNSNGNVTFGALNGDLTWVESLAAFNAGPARIAGAWDDIVVGAFGSNSTHTYTETPLGWTVAWHNAPEFTAVGSNNFSIRYDKASHEIELAYGDMSLNDAIVGITPGSLAVPLTMVLPTLLPSSVFCGGTPFTGLAVNQGVASVYTAITPFDLNHCRLFFQPTAFTGPGTVGYTIR